MHGILGQERAIDQLQQALRSGRVHHAWIFTGREGIGKFTTAVEMAKILLDAESRPNLRGEIESDPGGEVARLIDADAHPDLHVITRDLAEFSDSSRVRRAKRQNIPLDVLRQFMIGGTIQDTGTYFEPAASLSSRLGVGKVFIIDEAHALATDGQNALLKTLEEPPERTWIFLITDRPERLAPTIRSRSSLIRFDPLHDDAMNMWFDRANIDVDADEREWLLGFAEGSPGTARLAADFGFHAWAQQLDDMIRTASAGTFPPGFGRTLGDFVETYAQAWVKAGRNRSKDVANKNGCRHALHLLAAHARHALHLAATSRDESTLRRWAAIPDLLRDAEDALYSNVNQKLVLENLVIQWTSAVRSEHEPTMLPARR